MLIDGTLEMLRYRANSKHRRFYTLSSFPGQLHNLFKSSAQKAQKTFCLHKKSVQTISGKTYQSSAEKHWRTHLNLYFYSGALRLLFKLSLLKFGSWIRCKWLYLRNWKYYSKCLIHSKVRSSGNFAGFSPKSSALHLKSLCLWRKWKINTSSWSYFISHYIFVTQNKDHTEFLLLRVTAPYMCP